MTEITPVPSSRMRLLAALGPAFAALMLVVMVTAMLQHWGP